MKKITISVIALFVITAAITAAYAGFPLQATNTKSGVDANQVVYVVNVHYNIPTDKELCNTYLVVMRNQNGMLIGTPRVFNPSVATYYFNERGPAAGKRIAYLVVQPPIPLNQVCATELYTTPAAQDGVFLSGQKYLFDLYPQTQAPPH